MKRLYGALVLLSIIWGTSFLFIKLLLDDLPPAAVVFGRCFFGFISLMIFVVFARKKINLKQLPWKILILVGFINNALPWLFICISETKISSGLASIMNATTPIWTLIIGGIFFQASLRKLQWIGITVGFAGIFILSDIKAGDFMSGSMLGMLFMIFAAICYGLGAQLTRKYLTELSTLEVSLFTMLSASIISFFFNIPTGLAPLKQMMAAEHLLAFLCLGTLGSGIAYLLYYYMVKEGSAEFASLVTYLVPASAILWGAFLLNEEVHVSMLLGLIVIFCGVYITSIKEKKTMRNLAV